MTNLQRILGFVALLAMAPFAEAQTIYRYGMETFGSRGEAEAAMRAALGETGLWLEPLRDEIQGDTITHMYSVRVHNMPTLDFAWQGFAAVPTAGISACQFAGIPQTPLTMNLCNTETEYTERLEALFAFRDCSDPPPDVHTVSSLYHLSQGGIVDNSEIKTPLAGQLGVPISRIEGVTRQLGLYQSYWEGADCDQFFELVPTQDCEPGECSPGPQIQQHLVGVCPAGLVPRNTSHFHPGVTTRFPKACSADALEAIIAEPGPSDTDLPTAQSNAPCVGNPCNVVSGDKMLKDVLFDTAGLSFELRYHSLAAIPGESRLGRGWRHNFDSSITDSTASGSHWTLIHPEAVTTTFAVDPNDPDTLFSLLGGNGLIRRISSEELHFLPGDGEKWSYSKPGHGNRYHLSSILDLSTGRSIRLNRNANQVLVSVDVDGGRALSFQYDSEIGNRLVSVSQAGIALASLSYASSSPVDHRLDTVEFSDGTVRNYVYADTRFPFHVTGIVDENGDSFATYAYHADGKAHRSHRGSDAGTVELEYLPGQTTVTLPLGSQRVYEISRPASSVLTRLDRVTEDGLVVENTYTAARPWIPASTIDRNGHRTEFTYDTWNRVTGETRGAGTPEAVTVETDWNDAHNRPSQIRTRNSSSVVIRQADFTYNGRGQVLTVVEKDPRLPGRDRVTTFSYYESPEILVGRPQTIDGPRTVQDVTTFVYRESDHPNGDFRAGDLHTIENAEGHITEILEFDTAGRPMRIKDPNGEVTTLEYHPRGWLTSTSTDGEVLAYTYDDVGNLTQVIHPDGSFLAYDYDDAHRLISISDALGNSKSYTLDAAGHRIAEQNTDPADVLRRSLGRVYDSLGRLRQLLNHQGAVTAFTYDAEGNRIGVMNPLGRSSSFEYDALDRLTRVVDVLSPVSNRSTETTYDAQGLVRTVTDPLGHVTTYEVDGLGRLNRLESPDTGVTTFEVDAAGNRIQRTDARGVITQYSYDALGRLTAVTYPSDGSYDVSFTYDEGLNGLGRLTGMSDDRSGVTNWAYDKLGRVTLKTQTATDGVRFNVRYAYEHGRLASITYPSGKRLTYSYDATGRVTGLSSVGGLFSLPTPVLADVEYLPFGPVSKLDYARSMDQDRLYDLDFNPRGFAGGLSRSYDLDAAGELIGISGTGGLDVTYNYDPLGRLVLVENLYGHTLNDWSYDPNGNLTSHQGPNYDIDQDSNRLLAGFQSWYQYDAAGNMTQFSQARLGSRQMQYGPDHRLVSFSNLGGHVTGQYVHNGRGERTAKTATSFSVGGSGAVSTRFVYDENGKLLGEYDEAGRLITEYHWLGESLVSLNRGDQLFQVYTDHLGTPRAVRNGKDTVVWKWESLSTPFGFSQPDQDPDRDGESFVLNLRFPGQYFDVESGFFYNFFRDYDPSTGRYIESDPIGLEGGLNTYAYASSNPLRFVDPLGLQSEPFDGDFGIPTESFLETGFRRGLCEGLGLGCPETSCADECTQRFELCDSGQMTRVACGTVCLRFGRFAKKICFEKGCDIAEDLATGVCELERQRCLEQECGFDDDDGEEECSVP